MTRIAGIALALVVGALLGLICAEVAGPLVGPWNWLLLGVFVVLAEVYRRRRRRSD